MEALNKAIYSFRLDMPLVYIGVLFVLIIGSAAILYYADKKIDGTPMGILMFGLPLISAFLMTVGWPDPTPKRFIFCYIGAAAAIFGVSYMMLTTLKDAFSSDKFVRLAKKGDFAALEQQFGHNNLSWQGLKELKPETLNALARYCVPEGHFGEDFYGTLAPRLDQETALELLNTPNCNPAFRTYLFKRNPSDIDGSDLMWLFDYAEKSMSAKQILRQNLGTVIDKLTYPAYAAQLRQIAADVRNIDLPLRKAAYGKIPKSDEAFSRRYCPFCGSSEIKNGYLGLRMDMYFYGYSCNGCGHESAAPEGMGTAKPFDVSFPELVHEKA